MSVKQFEHGLDLDQVNQIKNFIVQQADQDQLNTLSVQLNTDNTGLLVYNTEQDVLEIWTGTEFMKISSDIQGDVVYKGPIDASQSLDTQCEAVPGYQYNIETSGILMMNDVDFIPYDYAETGDWVLFTSSTEAVVIQKGSIGPASYDYAGTVEIATDAEILAGESDSSIITPAGLSKYIDQSGFVNQYHAKIDLEAGVAVNIQHNLNLIDMNNFTFNAMSTMGKVNIDISSVDNNNISVLSLIDLTGVTIIIIGQSSKT